MIAKNNQKLLKLKLFFNSSLVGRIFILNTTNVAFASEFTYEPAAISEGSTFIATQLLQYPQKILGIIGLI